MAATMVELAALDADSGDEARAVVERLTQLGPVILLVDPGFPGRGRTAAGPGTIRADDLGPGVIPVPWTEVDPDASTGPPRSVGGRRLDPAAVARLTAIRAEHDADWLIATEATLASARACPGLHVVCIGPADDEVEPTRPDYRAHGLLDAVRFIETATVFD